MLVEFMQRYQARLQQQIDTLGENIASGGCGSFEQYKADCARRGELRHALNVARDIAAEMARED